MFYKYGEKANQVNPSHSIQWIMLSIKAVIWFSVQCQDKKNEDAITGSLLRGLDKQRDTEQGGVSTEPWMIRSRGNRVGCVCKEIGTRSKRALIAMFCMPVSYYIHFFKKCYKHKFKILCNTTPTWCCSCMGVKKSLSTWGKSNHSPISQ